MIQNFQRHDRQKGLFMQDSITHQPNLRATTATPTLLVTRVACWKVSSSVSAPVARRRESAANLLSFLMVAHMHSALELRSSSLDRRCPTRTFLVTISSALSLALRHAHPALHCASCTTNDSRYMARGSGSGTPLAKTLSPNPWWAMSEDANKHLGICTLFRRVLTAQIFHYFFNLGCQSPPFSLS